MKTVHIQLFVSFFFIYFFELSFQQIPSPGPVRGSVRDIITGAGAPGIKVDFLKWDNGNAEWEHLASNVTSSSGGINTLIHPDNFTCTNYMFKIYTQDYYNALGYNSFYPYVEIIFGKQDEDIHLVPITVGPYGYSAYRGRPKP